MAKMGRPRKDDGEAGTAQVRIAEDLVGILQDLRLVLPTTTAAILDPLIRVELKRMHDLYRGQIEKVKAADRAAEDARLKAVEEAMALGRDPKTKGFTPPRKKPGS